MNNCTRLQASKAERGVIGSFLAGGSISPRLTDYSDAVGLSMKMKRHNEKLRHRPEMAETERCGETSSAANTMLSHQCSHH